MSVYLIIDNLMFGLVQNKEGWRTDPETSRKYGERYYRGLAEAKMDILRIYRRKQGAQGWDTIPDYPLEENELQSYWQQKFADRYDVRVIAPSEKEYWLNWQIKPAGYNIFPLSLAGIPEGHRLAVRVGGNGRIRCPSRLLQELNAVLAENALHLPHGIGSYQVDEISQ